ncbi:MAG: dual specificity protein phosphatase family protein, partial [Candidatus Peribacteraceae bacterium]|nr:dual specificity protein phosphatase family protein [Candidatus Peribacteraceae bacterium]
GALLSLDGEFERPYNHHWCKFFVNVPLVNTVPITEDQISKILNFIYTNIVVHGRKTFIHSNLGMSRAPMIIALFLLAEKKMPLLQALTIITTKQNNVNPNRSLITGELVKYLKDFTFIDTKIPQATRVHTISASGKEGEVESVSLSNNILLGCTLTNKMIDRFKSTDVDVIIDLNDTRQKLPVEAQWFSHVHLPLADNQIKEMLPIVIKNVSKYSMRGRVYVMCKEMPKLLLFVENFVNQSNDKSLVEKMVSLRKQMISL